MNKDLEDIKEQALKLERYIVRYNSRSFNVGEALGLTGSKMMFELFEKIYRVQGDN